MSAEKDMDIPDAPGNEICGEGVLEIVADGFGFLRAAKADFLSSPEDIYVSPNQIRRFNLRTGHFIRGVIRPPMGTDRYRGLMRVDSVNGQPPESLAAAVGFDDLVAVYPNRRIRLNVEPADLTTRMVDLFTPIGLGQRMLIGTPSRNGAGSLLHAIADAIVQDCPKAMVTLLLVDARPEEVDDLRHNSNAEVVASTFEELASRHIQLAEMAMQKARRHVELGGDAVVLLDSMTRLTLAYEKVAESASRVLPCGFRASSMEQVQRIFGSGRSTRQGGSLTILATAANGESAVDQAIFQELEKTANAKLCLDGRSGEHCFSPGIDLSASATSRDDLLRDPIELQQVRRLRRVLRGKGLLEAMDLLRDRLGETPSNAQFLAAISELAMRGIAGHQVSSN